MFEDVSRLVIIGSIFFQNKLNDKFIWSDLVLSCHHLIMFLLFNLMITERDSHSSHFCLQSVKVFQRVQSPTHNPPKSAAGFIEYNQHAAADYTSTHSGTCFCLLAVHPPFNVKSPLSVRPICLQPPPAGARH